MPEIDLLYELSAFAQLRNLRGPHRSWNEILASAQRSVAVNEELGVEQSSYLRSGEALEMLAASRSIDAATRPQVQLSERDALYLRLDAGIAYAMAGNFPSATAVIGDWISRDLPPERLLDQARFASILGTIAPRFIGTILESVGDRIIPEEQRFLEDTNLLLQRQGSAAMGQVLSRWKSVVLATLDDVYKSSLLRSARVVLYQISALSTWTILGEYRDNLPDGYIESLGRAGIRLLLPSQETAIKTQGFLTGTDNVLVTMPTSTGKSLLGQLCMAAALGKSGGLVAYIAPYQALAHQVFTDIRASTPRDVQVERAVGGYSPAEELEPTLRPTVVVATPERFDATLRHRPELFEQLRCVVVDEAHILEQGERGVRLEGMLARMRLQQLGGRGMRVVLQSAVISETDRIQQWLRIPDGLVVRSSWRPTARRLALWSQEGKLEYFFADDPLRPNGIDPSRVVADRVLPWPNPTLRPPHTFAQNQAQLPPSRENVAFLCSTLLADFGEPILCICSTRAETRAVAFAIWERFGDVPAGNITVRLQARIAQRWPHLRLLARCLERGVAFHNASLPSEVRESIERAVTERELKVIVATTTLAEGVNLPVRFVVLADWLTWDDARQRVMSSLLFRNIAGRCGRAGYFSEGDTIVYANPIGDDNLTSPVSANKQRILQGLIAPASVNVGSAVGSLATDTYGETRRRVLSSALASQFLAAARENPALDDLVRQFGGRLLAARSAEPNRVRDLLQDIEADFIGGDLPVARRASPLLVTSFGESCVLTGLAPESCRTLVGALDGLAGRLWSTPSELLADLLDSVHSVAEALTTPLISIYKARSRYPVKQAEFANVIQAWLAGQPLEEMFVRLRYAAGSRRAPPVSDWSVGLLTPSTWDAEFDKFNDFITQVLQNFLAWVCRAADELKQFSSTDWPRQENWQLLADYLEHGVDTQWSVHAYQVGCPVSRTAVAPFGRAATERGTDDAATWVIPPDLPAGSSTAWIDARLEAVESNPSHAVRREELQASGMREWLLTWRPA